MLKQAIDFKKLKITPIDNREDIELARDLMERHHYLGDIQGDFMSQAIVKDS